MGAKHSPGQHPLGQHVRVPVLRELVMLGGGGVRVEEQGEACVKGTCRGPCPCLPEPLRKGVLGVARLWSLPRASSRCGTLQILITHSQGALSRRSAGMARGRQDGLGLQRRHWLRNPISGYP